MSYSLMTNKKVISERSVLNHLPGFNDTVAVLWRSLKIYFECLLYKRTTSVDSKMNGKESSKVYSNLERMIE